jgi:hypothetical protein
VKTDFAKSIDKNKANSNGFAHISMHLCNKSAFYGNILGEIKEIFLPLQHNV